MVKKTRMNVTTLVVMCGVMVSVFFGNVRSGDSSTTPQDEVGALTNQAGLQLPMSNQGSEVPSISSTFTIPPPTDESGGSQEVTQVQQQIQSSPESGESSSNHVTANPVTATPVTTEPENTPPATPTTETGGSDGNNAPENSGSVENVDQEVTNQLQNVTKLDVTGDSGDSGASVQNTIDPTQLVGSPAPQNQHEDRVGNYDLEEPVTLDEGNLAFDELHNQIVYAEMETIAVQPPFFESTGLSWDDIKEQWPDDLDEFNEIILGELVRARFKTDPIGKFRNFEVRGIDAGEFSFVTFVDLDAKEYERREYKFFFDTAVALSQKSTDAVPRVVYFREVDENCPSVRTNPPQAPTVKKCNLYYKRTEADYSFVVDLLGPQMGSSILACICRATLTLQNQPNIELMCSSDAVTDNAWKVLTKRELDSFDAMLKKNENGKYLMNDHGQFVLEAPEEITQMISPTAVSDSGMNLHDMIQNDNPDLSISGGVVNPSPGAQDVVVNSTVTTTSTGGDATANTTDTVINTDTADVTNAISQLSPNAMSSD